MERTTIIGRICFFHFLDAESIKKNHPIIVHPNNKFKMNIAPVFMFLFSDAIKVGRKYHIITMRRKRSETIHCVNEYQSICSSRKILKKTNNPAIKITLIPAIKIILIFFFITLIRIELYTKT